MSQDSKVYPALFVGIGLVFLQSSFITISVVIFYNQFTYSRKTMRYHILLKASLFSRA